MSLLNLDSIIDVSVYISPTAVVGNAYNLGLILGDSTVISATDRVKIYSNTTDMIADGFLTTSPEYLAAQLYFGQTPQPGKVAIGRWDKTSSETAVQALNACRTKNQDWYAAYVIDNVKADILLLAAAVEAMTPKTVLFYTTQDSDVPLGTAGNIFETMKGLKYRRSIGQYSSTNANAATAIMGYAMGANTGLANSAYTLAYKQEVGVTVEDLTESQVNTILNNNGNVYVNRGSAYNLFQQGRMADGTPFDEVINLDKLVNDIQIAGMNALSTTTKIPQTEDGMTYLINQLTAPLEQARKIGFIATGKWNGPSILTLSNGDILPNGYLILAESILDQSEADRQARKAPPIYIPIKLAGAIEYVTIGVYVNQ